MWYNQGMERSTIRCVIHGSFGKHFAEIQRVARLFQSVGIEVLAPKAAKLTSQTDGFALFEDEQGEDPRLVELRYLHYLRKLGESGFSYFVNPEGYIGTSASYELAVAQLTNVRCFFMERPIGHPAYVQQSTIWPPEALAHYAEEHGGLPPEMLQPNEKLIHKLWVDLMVPGSVIATGAIIERRVRDKTEILLVKTHKWGDRYSIVGGKVRRNERLHDALLREVYEETNLKGSIGRHLVTFDQLKDSGYYQRGVQHVFVDNVVTVGRKKVTLNEEAQSYIWAPADEALAALDIEPNAKTTVELYAGLRKTTDPLVV
jgi:ADP-ribose pyrophosphatase YjhB (NUDIX family)